MRVKARSLWRSVKDDLRIEFVPQRLTSSGGLELVRRSLRGFAVVGRLRRALATLPSDYGRARLALLLVALFDVGARRLEHLRDLTGDPLITRVCGLARIPTARTVSTWLKPFTQATLAPLAQLNHDLVLEPLAACRLPRLTIDVDGTVISTGAQVQWAFLGFNPHRRKHRSYYPLLAHVAQTGHILRLKHRPGNVHDSTQAAAFVREWIDTVRAGLGRGVPLEFRMDAAFFTRDSLRLLENRRCAYAIKVGYWSWLPLKQLAAERAAWRPRAPGVTGFEHRLTLPQWNLTVRIMASRQPVQHATRKNVQPDLFTPDDGHFEYHAVATNLPLRLAALFAFVCGRGAQEKTLADLKSEFALDVVPTNHYGATRAWQQRCVLAHTLFRNFQRAPGAEPKRRSRKRTYAYLLQSIRTFRFMVIARAGRVTRINGRNVLRLAQNASVEQLYDRLQHALAA